MSTQELSWVQKEIAVLKTKLLNTELSITKRAALMEELVAFYTLAERAMKADKE